MVNFTAFITLLMGITTFFKDNIPGANIFTSWSQKLLAAPPQPYYDREGKFTITYRGIEEEYTIITPVYLTTTFYTTTFTEAPAITDAFTTTTALPGKELILFTGTVTSPSFFTLAKEFVCAMFTLPPAVTANAASVVTAFLFGTLLLLAYVGFLASSPPVMKPEDLLYLEEQVYEKDELLKRLRRWHGEDLAELRGRLQVQREWADERLATTIAGHKSAMADKDREILALRQELAGADLREEEARFKSSDEVIKMHKEIGHLRSVIDDLDQQLETTGALAALTEEAQEKVKDAEERAIAAAQQALEANQKVEAAEKAHKEKTIAERERAQAAIDKVVKTAYELQDEVKVEKYKVQDLRAEVKKLEARVVGAAPVPQRPVLEGKSSDTRAKEVRDRLQAAAKSALGTSSAPEPAAPDAATAAPAATAPEPIAPGAQQEQVRRIRRRAPVGPFPDLRGRQGGKK